jgi:hypothetical protein
LYRPAGNNELLELFIDKTLPKVQTAFPQNGTVYRGGDKVWVKPGSYILSAAMQLKNASSSL